VTNTLPSLLAYLGITFGLGWAAWHAVFRLDLPAKSAKFQLAILPGACAPAAAAAIVRWLMTEQGFEGVRFVPRIAETWPYYVVGLVAPIAVALASYAITRFTGLHRFATEVRPVRSRMKFLTILPAVAILTAPFQFGEEFGWRGFFQAEILPSWPLLAALITGVVWALWHLPLHRAGFGTQHERLNGFAAFTLHSVLLSIFLGWIFLRTGDVWAVALAHMANNAIGVSLIESLLPGETKRHVIGYEGLVTAIPMGAICLAIVLSGGLSP